MASERMAYINGKIVPESQATVSIRDRGFLQGDAVFVGQGEDRLRRRQVRREGFVDVSRLAAGKHLTAQIKM